MSKPNFKEIDTNNDGKISLDEWTKAGFDKATFKKIDTDGDGEISKKEFTKYYNGDVLEEIESMLKNIVKEAEDDDTKGDDDKTDDANGDDNGDDNKDDKDNKKDDEKDEKGDKKDKDDDKKDKDSDGKKADMGKIKELVTDVLDEIKDLRAELHTAQESAVDYDKIQGWVVNEFGGELKSQIANGVQKWITEEYTKEIANNVEGWVTECFAPTVEGWVCEQFAPTIEGWVNEQFAPTVEGWISECFAPTVEGWVCEQFAPTINDWVNEQFAPTVQQWLVEQYTPTVETWLNEHYAEEQNQKVYESVNEFFESKGDENLERISSILETVENIGDAKEVAKTINESIEDKYATEYIVANMPSQYKPSWNMCSESKKDDIISRSKIYDFTKEGVLEQFWATTDFSEKQVNENEKKSMQSVYESNVFAQMRRLQGNY